MAVAEQSYLGLSCGELMWEFALPLEVLTERRGKEGHGNPPETPLAPDSLPRFL